MMDIEAIKDRLDYCQHTGEFRWSRDGGTRARKGALAGSVNAIGYRLIRIGKKDHLAHRLAWAFVYGVVPPMIDHVDGNKLNNSIGNLRAANKSLNGANRGAQRNSISGCKGVSKHHRKWTATITINGKGKYIGLFNTKEEASAAYMKAAESAFGEFARAA